ncbi:MAG: hemerythrin domain-containing protein [Calditrichaeota bacterium]|nr:hemerythrin domain-containing protein [Calditrichota bacterium]
MELINELRQEHQVLLQMISQIKNLGILSDEGYFKLLNSKQILIDHLTKEDTALYPLLYKGARKDKELKDLLYNLLSEMNNLTSEVLDFYSKYDDRTSFSKEEFAKDITYVMLQLKNRIVKEEEHLYRAYDKLRKVKPDLWTQFRLAFVPVQDDGEKRYKTLAGIRYDMDQTYQ